MINQPFTLLAEPPLVRRFPHRRRHPCLQVWGCEAGVWFFKLPSRVSHQLHVWGSIEFPLRYLLRVRLGAPLRAPLEDP